MKPVDIVLVRSIYSRNIGYVSRAMTNMGAGRLILIAPQCEIDNEAHSAAAGAQQKLIEANCYESWSEFYENEPEGVRFAFSARSHKCTDHMSFTDRIEKLIVANEPLFNSQIYFIFGPENHGLSNQDFEFVNFVETLPVYGAFKSLNLSHAVLLALSIYGQTSARHSTKPHDSPHKDETHTRPDLFYFPEDAVRNWLLALGFDLERHNDNAYSALKRLLLKNLATAKELKIFEAVVNQTVRKLNKKD